MSERSEEAVAKVLEAALFAAQKHSRCRRKNADASPYINHPLAVAETLIASGVTDTAVLVSALLHDTVEDTETTIEEIEERFGARVAAIVGEVTDDKSLKKEERKRLQIEKAASKSPEARLVKLGDKISNLRGILDDPPADWDRRRKAEYFAWAGRVVDGMRGTSAQLEAEFDRLLDQGRTAFRQS